MVCARISSRFWFPEVTTIEAAAKTPITTTPIEVPTSNLKWKWLGLSSHSTARRGSPSFLLGMPEAGATVGGGIVGSVHQQFHCHGAQQPPPFPHQFSIFLDRERAAGSIRRRVQVIVAWLGRHR